MAHRHAVQKKNVGGAAVSYGNPKVISEARSTENKKHGGRAKRKEGGRVAGFKSGGRLDKRARGGGVGADKSPFSSAHIKGSHPPAHNPKAHKDGGKVKG